VRNAFSGFDAGWLEVVWYGWHGFRRGIATNLDELGVPINVVQKILRHKDEATTKRFYRKTRSKSVEEGMRRLEETLDETTLDSPQIHPKVHQDRDTASAKRLN
jgi:hypothetical protein